VAITTPGAYSEEGECQTADDQLCLLGGRFRVQVQWRNQHATPGQQVHGTGHPLPASGSDRSGYFWFFNPDNVELVAKVLDGNSVNGFYWTFYGALSDVEYWITVTDTEERASRTYYNPPGEVCGLGDTQSIAGRSRLTAAPAQIVGSRLGAAPAPPEGAPGQSALALAAPPTRITSPLETCVEDDRTLCLLDGRFRVSVSWEDQHNGGSGLGGAVPFSDRTGFFWFFNPANVELVVKVLDGTPVNGKIWVFYGALSDVGYTLEVEDLEGEQTVRRYVNTPGNLCGDADTGAF
jgi:hypothetical protein